MELSQQLLAAGLVMAMFLVALAAAQRRGWLRLQLPARTPAGCSLILVDRFTLTPQHQLHLMRIVANSEDQGNGDRTLLIATHPGGVSVVEQLPAARGAHAS